VCFFWWDWVLERCPKVIPTGGICIVFYRIISTLGREGFRNFTKKNNEKAK